VFSANLPPISPIPATPPSPTGAGVETIIPLAADVVDAVTVTSKEIAIAAGVMLLLAVIFFFVRQFFVNWLVRDFKKSPNSADMAGWGLFGFLFFGSAIPVLAVTSGALLRVLFIAPLGALALASLVLCVVAARKS